MTERFDVGVNYWPASSAMRWWRRFDADEVDRDFARIRAAGGDLVRFFLLWEDFQPAAGTVSERALAHLVTVADAARRHELRIIPTSLDSNGLPVIASGHVLERITQRVIEWSAKLETAVDLQDGELRIGNGT